MILTYITFFVAVLYSFFICHCIFFWKKIPETSAVDLSNPDLYATVIVPVRNESGNITALLKSLVKQDYSNTNYEVIVVDDHSTDDTFTKAAEYFSFNNFLNGRCILSGGHSKKEAIAWGVRESKGDIIITTDGDSEVGAQWLRTMIQPFIKSDAFLACGPVKMCGATDVLSNLQKIEFAGLSAISASGIFSGHPLFCNGANLAFSKKVFCEAGGYENSLSASGDDTQLLLKIHERHPGKIVFVKDKRAIVETGLQEKIGDLWQQRLRWTSKIPFTLTPLTITIAIISWLIHALMLIQFFIVLFNHDILPLVLLLIMKAIPEIILLRSAGTFYGEKINPLFIFVMQPVYAIYIVFVGLIAPLVKFSWKGRLSK